MINKAYLLYLTGYEYKGGFFEFRINRFTNNIEGSFIIHIANGSLCKFNYSKADLLTEEGFVKILEDIKRKVDKELDIIEEKENEKNKVKSMMHEMFSE